MQSPLVGDDNCLDDAELWELIDSAAATHRGSFKPLQSRHLSSPRKPLLITHSNRNPPVVTELPVSHQVCNDAIEYRRASKVVQKQPHYTVQTVETPPSEAKQRSWKVQPQKVIKREDQNRGKGMAERYQCASDTHDNVHRFSNPSRFPLHDIASPGSMFTSSCELAGRSKATNALSEMKENRSLCGNGAAVDEWMAELPSASMFKQFQTAAMSVLEKGDFMLMQGKPFIKKSGWRKIAFFFNISFEIKDKSIDFDQNNNVLRAEFVVRASMKSGRFTDSWGSCDRGEKRFTKPNHDIPSTAETRAKTRACQDLLGIGEYKVGSCEW
eukprot:c20770_g1_i1 orf=445-1425(-)